MHSEGLFDYDFSLRRIAEIEKEMSRPDFWSDSVNASKLVEELKTLKARTQPIESISRKLEGIEELLEIAEPEDSAELQSELGKVEEEVRGLELQTLFSGRYDLKNAYLSIQAGAGGTDACDWASMLLRMYTRWLSSKGFEHRLIHLEPGDEAGIRSASLDVRGPCAYGYLKSEDGVHRLVRISPFDSNARRHTSFVAVEVVPQLDEELEVELKDEELKIEFCRSSGPGGQHVNVTDSAVKIIHIPTGLVAQCQSERSQHQNRRKALELLKAKIHQLKLRQREQEIERLTGGREEIAWGNQIRSYVLHPYTLVKDHRTQIQTSTVDRVLDGDIDAFIEAYLRQNAGRKK